jgi:hypothetical protein
MRRQLEIGAPNEAFYEDGVIDVVYKGSIDEAAARNIVRMATEYSLGKHSVWVTDMTDLQTFTPEARKVFGKGEVFSSESYSHVYLVGATVRVKAILALVLTATKLVGTGKIDIHYVASRDEARALARAKVNELIASGEAKLPT